VINWTACANALITTSAAASPYCLRKLAEWPVSPANEIRDLILSSSGRATNRIAGARRRTPFLIWGANGCPKGRGGRRRRRRIEQGLTAAPASRRKTQPGNEPEQQNENYQRHPVHFQNGVALSNLGIPPMNARETKWSWWYLLLLIQFIPALWVPFYNFLAVHGAW
jgi:hypothetical protein